MRADALRRLTRWIDANLDRLPDDFVAMPFDHQIIGSVLTKERMRLVQYLRKEGPVHSLQELAEALGRDRSAVSRDLVLLEHQFVEVTKHGRQKTIRALDRPIVIY